MDNKIKLLLGGEERTLDFGKNAILRHLGALTEESGFNLLDTGIWRDPAKSWKATYYFIHAGLLCSGHKNLSAEQVTEWVDELPLNVLDDVKFAGYAAITQKPIEEIKNLFAQVEKVVKQNGTTQATEKIL